MRGDIYKLPPANFNNKLTNFNALQIGDTNYYLLITETPITDTIIDTWYVHPGIYSGPLPLGEVIGKIEDSLIKSYITSQQGLKEALSCISSVCQKPEILVHMAFKEWINTNENNNT